MAKVKIKKKENTEKAPSKTLKIKKPQIKFVKPDIKKLTKSKGVKVLGMILIAFVALILVDLFFQYLNNGYSVAVVDGVRISKSKYHQRLEKQYGPSIAQQLIDEQLIKNEAKKAGVEASDQEVQVKLEEIIENVGGDEAYQQALLANNITEQELKDQILLDILATKILEPQLEYTEDDVKAFFEQYSASIYPNETAALEEGEKLDFEQFKEGVEDIYIQQQVESEKYTWLDSLYSNYKIQDNSAETPKYGVLTATINIVKNLVDDINSNTDTE